MVLMINESYVAEKIFLLISALIALYAFQQGDEVEIQGKTIANPKPCADWTDLSVKIISACVKGKNCTFFFRQYSILTANEWFGDFQVVSRLNRSFSKFELRVRYDNNMDEKKIYELPKNKPNSFDFSTDKKFHTDNEVINFSVDKGYKSLTLGVRGPDFCGNFKLIRLYYYKCPATTKALVNFIATPAPSKRNSSIELKGNCAENAVQNKISSPLTMKCYYNGSYEVFGNCVCKAGFSNLDNGTRNKECTG